MTCNGRPLIRTISASISRCSARSSDMPIVQPICPTPNCANTCDSAKNSSRDAT